MRLDRLNRLRSTAHRLDRLGKFFDRLDYLDSRAENWVYIFYYPGMYSHCMQQKSEYIQREHGTVMWCLNGRTVRRTIRRTVRQCKHHVRH